MNSFHADNNSGITMNIEFLSGVFVNDINRDFFSSIISILESECNKIVKNMDYSCKSHIFRRILILFDEYVQLV